MNIIRITRRISILLMIFGLITTNVLSITNEKFHDLLSGLFSQIPLSDFMSKSKSKKFQSIVAENKHLKNQNEVFKQKKRLRKAKIEKAHKISKRVILRTMKNVSLNVSSVAGEAIPYLGVGIILAVTASDVYAGCETIKDTNELLNLLDIEDLKAEESQVCGLNLPTEKQVKESIREFESVLGGTIYEILN